jgi:universal stress protein A
LQDDAILRVAAGSQIAQWSIIMTRKPSILCPIDFSESSRGALRYAGTIAEHFGASLTMLAVNDPLLMEAAEVAGTPDRVKVDTIREIERFRKQTFGARGPGGTAEVQVDVASGKPAQEILRVARERGFELIVMASHGSTGFRKLFFGSTTERVLRETTVPTLVTPGGDQGPQALDEVRRLVRRVLVPVDLSQETPH